MRVSRVRRLGIRRRKRNKILVNFFVVIPLASIIIGYLVTDLYILPVMCQGMP